MTADPAAIRALACWLRDQDVDLRAEADRLVALTEATGWEGAAGEAFLTRVREQGAALRRTAGLHADAAAALDRHAVAVEERLVLLGCVERRVGELLETARGLAGQVPGALDTVERFVPPLPEDPAWLDVDVAALARALGAGA